MPNQPGETPLRIFGDRSKFRTDLRRRINLADDLLARIDAAREVFKEASLPSSGLERALELGRVAQPLTAAERSVSEWAGRNRRLLVERLGSAAKDVPLDTRAPIRSRHSDSDNLERRAETCTEIVRAGQEQLREVLARLPDPRQVPSCDPSERFVELREANLIEVAALDALLRRMTPLRTTPQISRAIGAAKELVEACNRAACNRFGVRYPDGDFLRLGKIVRKEIGAREPSELSTKAIRAMEQMFSGISTVELALSTLRNELGEGHGRASLPKGLRPRHGQLAVDIAETHVRFLVATLRDLELL